MSASHLALTRISSRKPTSPSEGNGDLERAGEPLPRSGPAKLSTSHTFHLSYIWEPLKAHFTPDRKMGPAPTFSMSLKATVQDSWLNILLLCIPISWALHFVWTDPSSTQDTIIFIFSFLAIIPLAKLMGFATEELALRVGQTIGGLLNATLGNAVELIVAIIALTKCQLQIVQSSLVGSILSNLLLVLGMCFFAGGLKFSEQGFLNSAAQLNSSLLVLSVIAVLLPAAFHFAVTPTSQSANTQAQVAAFVANGTTNGTNPLDPNEGQDILQMSRGVAVILLFIYAAYLVFQLWSHAHLYTDDAASINVAASTPYPENLRRPHLLHYGGARTSTTVLPVARPASAILPSAIVPHDGADEPHLMEAPRFHPEHIIIGSSPPKNLDPDAPQLNVASAFILLGVVTALVALTADFLVDSIGGLTASGNVTQEWVGLILLPIVGNAAEHVTAVTVSVKDKLTLSLGVAVGSSIQIALFVIPFLVVVAWIMGKPLSLLFDPFESVVLFLSVLTVNYAVADGKSNWLEGLILMSLYVIVAVSFWFYPGVNTAAQILLSC